MSEVSSSRFRRYVSELCAFNQSALDDGGLFQPAVEPALGHLNGRASRALRASVKLKELRRLGAFFTGERLAREAAALLPQVRRGSVVVDPACGCGDLLLAVAARLPVTTSVERTLESWGRVLYGVDIESAFVETARQRLALLALLRGARPEQGNIDVAELLPGITVGDGLQASRLLRRATHVLLNPPYGQIQVPTTCEWASGKATAAALWTEYVLHEVPLGCDVVAILPDVLRSGSRYRTWRTTTQRFARIASVTSKGQFDALTDIDVFLFACTRGQHHLDNPWQVPLSGSAVLRSRCSVSVGPVVPHRDPETGPLVPYLTTRQLPLRGVHCVEDRRRYAKKLFEAPFVVLRRTSRPTAASEHSRLNPVVITSATPVAVENHLLVLQPDDATLSACHQLASDLQGAAVTAWLNERIRCRHLTVSAVREIPLRILTSSGQPVTL